MNAIEHIIKKLPPDQLKEVEDFALFLIERKQKIKSDTKFLKQNWAGGLKKYKNKYTSLELQKKALNEWRF